MLLRKSLEFRKGSTSGVTSSRCRQSEEGDADIGAVPIPRCTQSEFLSTEDPISDQDKPVNGETAVYSDLFETSIVFLFTPNTFAAPTSVYFSGNLDWNQDLAVNQSTNLPPKEVF